MTKLVVRSSVVTVVLAALILLSAPAKAQSLTSGITVNVPFDFYIGSQKMPAGQYSVKHQSDPSLLRFSDGNGHSMVAISNAAYINSGKLNGELIFNRYGEQYFLSMVHWPDTPAGRELLKSSVETQLARNSSAEKVIATTSNR